jgi:hypothetical protein
MTVNANNEASLLTNWNRNASVSMNRTCRAGDKIAIGAKFRSLLVDPSIKRHISRRHIVEAVILKELS